MEVSVFVGADRGFFVLTRATLDLGYLGTSFCTLSFPIAISSNASCSYSYAIGKHNK
ncbi:unnamed protein product, partial [Nesidiocoris tenuis]